MWWRAAVATVVAFVSVASADPDRSKQLFNEGRDLAMHGRYADACDRFERSFELVSAPGTELNLGDCQEHLGHLADAWRLFVDAATKFAAVSEPSGAAVARERAKVLAPRLATIVIPLGDSADTEVTVAGRTVAATSQIRELVDPGQIEIRIVRRGQPPLSRTVHVDAGDTRAVDLSPTEEPLQPTQTEIATTTATRRPSRVLAAWVLAGTGAAIAVAGVLVAAQAHSAYQAQIDNGNCSTPNGRLECNGTGFAATSAAGTRADVGTGLGIAGLALGAAAAIVYITAPRGTAVVPVATSQAIGLAVTLRF